MPTCRNLLAAFALAAIPTAAAAGPIGFNYQTTVTPRPGNPDPAAISLTSPRWVPWDPATLSQSGSAVDNAVVANLVFQGAAAWADLNPIPRYQSGGQNWVTGRFPVDVNVRLTDAVSGQSADVALTGEGYADWFIRWDNDIRPNSVTLNLGFANSFGTHAVGYEGYYDETDLPLGSTRYHLRYDTRDDHDRYAFGTITVQALPADAPEPGTLALVGCGLPMAGLWLRKRRK